MGAQREQIMKKMLGEGITRLIASLLFGTKPLDTGVFVLVSVTLLVVAALACTLPAWRAARLNPMEALRAE